MSVENLITQHLDIWTSSIKTKSAAGRGSSKKLELVGIKKLRELILELAVRGKLVAQDPNDEPASELLKKIEAEKAQLVKDGKIKKQKPLLPVADEDKTFELPEGWAFCRLGNIIQISSGTGLTAANMNAIGTIPVYGGNGVTGYHDQGNVFKETLVIGRVGYYCGSVHLTPPIAWVTDNAFVTTFSEDNIFIDYLVWLLKGTNLKEEENATAQPVISGRKLYPINIALPPTKEQHRIVSKVDELMALCDQLEAQTEASIDAHKTLVEVLLATLTDAKDADELNESWQRLSQYFDVLFTTEASIDQLKQTILQLAVMGKLVKQDPKDEPVDKLFNRIKTNETLRVKNKEIQKPKAVLESAMPNVQVPSSWRYFQMGSLAFVTKLAGFEYTKNMAGVLDDTGEIPVIRAQNVRPFRPDLRNLKFIDLQTSIRLQRCALDKPCLLMTFIGAGIGDTCIFNENIRWHLAPNVAKIEPFADLCLDYLALYLNADIGRAEIFKSMKSTAQPSLSMTTIREIWISIPPLPEQYKIAAEVEKLLAFCDSLKSRLKEAQTTQLHLTNAIMEQAL